MACDECRRRKIKCERKQGNAWCTSCIGLACKCIQHCSSSVVVQASPFLSPLTPTSSNVVSATPISSPPALTRSGKLRACDECKRRKIKCETTDGSMSCHHCIKIGGDCIRSGHPTPRSSAKDSPRSLFQPSVRTPTKYQRNKQPKCVQATGYYLFCSANMLCRLRMRILDGFNHAEEAVVLAGVSDPEDNDYSPAKRSRKRMRVVNKG